MPHLVNFRVLKTMDAEQDVAAVWTPNLAALCDKCMEGVRSGEPLERPDGERTGDKEEASQNYRQTAIGFTQEEACECPVETE